MIFFNYLKQSKLWHKLQQMHWVNFSSSWPSATLMQEECPFLHIMVKSEVGIRNVNVLRMEVLFKQNWDNMSNFVMSEVLHVYVLIHTRTNNHIFRP